MSWRQFTKVKLVLRRAVKISFPDINSCLTVTCACEGGVVVGGHAVLMPEANQLSLKTLNLDNAVSLVDVEKWTNGGKGMVQIVFHPATKTVQVLPNQGGKALHEEKWQ
jgi:hypothetical protein